MELQLPQLRRCAQGQHSCRAPHAILDRGVEQRRRLGAVQRLARRARPDQGLPRPAARPRHPRHRHPRHRPGRRPDRPHHRPADAARGQAAGDLVHRHGPRGSHHRQSAVQHPGSLLRRELASPPDRARQRLRDRRHRASALHQRGAQEQGAALLAASRQPARGRQHRHAHHRHAHRPPGVLCARAGRDRAAPAAVARTGRRGDGGRDLLDRRRDGAPGHLQQARARHRPPAAVRRGRHDQRAAAAQGQAQDLDPHQQHQSRSWTRIRPSARS